MKIKFNALVHSASGAMGNLVLYDLDGQPVARSKGKPPSKEPTAAQLRHQALVKQAAAWSRQTMADPKQKADYAAACHGHQTPYNIGFRDFMTPPVIEAINLDGYAGQVGDAIQIKAWDDFEVKSVHVTIRDEANNLVEQGSAARGSSPNEWHYAATMAVTPGQSVQVEVTALDRPGNQAQAHQWQHVSAAPDVGAGGPPPVASKQTPR